MLACSSRQVIHRPLRRRRERIRAPSRRASRAALEHCCERPIPEVAGVTASEKYTCDYVSAGRNTGTDHAEFLHSGHSNRTVDVYTSLETLAENWSTKHTSGEPHSAFHVHQYHVHNVHSNIWNLHRNGHRNSNRSQDRNGTYKRSLVTTEALMIEKDR